MRQVFYCSLNNYLAPGQTVVFDDHEGQDFRVIPWKKKSVKYVCVNNENNECYKIKKTKINYQRNLMEKILVDTHAFFFYFAENSFLTALK